MADKLGILVTSNKYLDYIMKLTEAALARDKEVQIFFTGQSVLLTRAPEFAQLAEKAKVSVCDVSFRALCLKEEDVPCLGFKDFATQAKNAELIKNSDRYLVF